MTVSRRHFILGAGTAIAGTAILPGFRRRAFAAANDDTLKLAMSARGVQTLDPARHVQGADAWANVHIHDTLVISPYGRFAQRPEEFLPILATEWEMSEDAKTWTFTLREGVQFHKGYGEFTSDDVVFTITRLKDPNQISTNRVMYDNITNVAADGKYKVVFTLAQPDPLFLGGPIQDLSCGILSRKATEERGDDYGKDPIGTGAYIFDRIDEDPSQGVHMTANPDYFRGKPPIGNFQVMYIPDTTARTLALLNGDVQMIEGVRAPGWVPSIQQRDSSLQFDISSPGSLFGMWFNLTREPLQIPEVRQAFAYAINRDEIAKALAPFGKRTWGVNAPGFPGGLTEDQVPPELRYDFNPDKARELLTQAGFANGFRLDAQTSQREDYSSIMLIVQEQMRAVGVDINLDIMDHTAYHAAKGKDQNSLPQNSRSFPPVPTLPLQAMAASASEVNSEGTGGGNYAHYGVTVKGIDDTLDQALNEPNFDKRIALVQDCEFQIMRDLPLIPLVTTGFVMVRSPSLDLGYEVQSAYAYWRLDQAHFV